MRVGADWKVNAANTLTCLGVYDFERHMDVAQVPFILGSTGQRERFWFWREQEETGFTNINARPPAPVRPRPATSSSVNLQYTRGLEDEAYFLNEVSRVRVGHRQ